MDDRERHAAGMKIRREVLGSAHVDQAEAVKTSFSEPTVLVLIWPPAPGARLA